MTAIKVKPLEWLHDGVTSYAYCGVTDARWTACNAGERARAEDAREKRILSALDPQCLSSYEAMERRVAEMEEALKPFVTTWADEHGWSDTACQKDRIVDWFGPSDFRRAAAALSQSQAVGTPAPQNHTTGETYADKHGELRRLREVRRLGTRAMAAEIGISPATLNRAENGETVSVEVAAKIGPYIGKCLCCGQLIGSAPPENHAMGKAEAFDQIVAAHKKHVDAVNAYNERRKLVEAERARGNWRIKIDFEYRAMSDAQSEYFRTVQELADAAIASPAPQTNTKVDTSFISDLLRQVVGDNRRLCLDAATMIECLSRQAPPEVHEPAGWFNYNEYHGYQQVAAEYESPPRIPLYKMPPQTHAAPTVTREDAIKFLEGACRNWSKVPRLSNDDLQDVATELSRFVASRPAPENRALGGGE